MSCVDGGLSSGPGDDQTIDGTASFHNIAYARKLITINYYNHMLKKLRVHLAAVIL